MQIKTFTITPGFAERSEAEINLFLRSHRILRMENHLAEQAARGRRPQGEQVRALTASA